MLVVNKLQYLWDESFQFLAGGRLWIGYIGERRTEIMA
jgi:hypothetical protein